MAALAQNFKSPMRQNLPSSCKDPVCKMAPQLLMCSLTVRHLPHHWHADEILIGSKMNICPVLKENQLSFCCAYCGHGVTSSTDSAKEQEVCSQELCVYLGQDHQRQSCRVPGIRTGMHNGSGQAFNEKDRIFSETRRKLQGGALPVVEFMVCELMVCGEPQFLVSPGGLSSMPPRTMLKKSLTQLSPAPTPTMRALTDGDSCL